ncbi:MAG: cation-translocating P-type ATPase [Coriobacteriia bacterium]|nr:cation-translocating P-type ATPase [Coriobacteriia bacterium]
MQFMAALPHKAFQLLSGLALTLVGGLALAISLLMLLLGTNAAVDPAWLTILICGYPLLYLSCEQLLQGKGINRIGSDLLVLTAMSASIVIGELFAAGEVAFIMALGTILEEKSVERAQRGLTGLIKLTPQLGRRIQSGLEEMVLVEQIRPGDLLRVLPGELVAADGRIVFGQTSIDESVLTGESLPQDKDVGDLVYSGSLNRFGSIDIEATKVGEDSSIKRLIRLIQEAQASKAPTQRIVDRWSAWLVPIVLAITAAVFLLTQDVVRAVTVMVVFCPCALVLATPTSVIAAIGQAAKHGVVVRSGDALERMGKVDTMAFDKTGTLTSGRLLVSDVLPLSGDLTPDRLLQLAASAEARSEHPLGQAIVTSAKARGVTVHESQSFRMMPGKGVQAQVDGLSVYCGNIGWLAQEGIAIDAGDPGAGIGDTKVGIESAEVGTGDIAIDTGAAGLLADLQQEGKAVVGVADAANNSMLGLIALTDEPRPDAPATVQAMSDSGIKAVLLTGDNRQAASYLARGVGIADYHFGLLPEGKVELIRSMQQQGQTVGMLGDGINDAPALAAADVGIAMGGLGSELAVQAADIALMGDDISRLPYLKRLSNATVRLIKTNIAISMAINAVAIVLSALGLLNPVTGALVHNVGSVVVVLNAALLYDRKLD